MTAPTACSVLFVDDDAGLRELVPDYLRAHGLEVRVAGDGAAMWAALANWQPDVIVLDLMLPGEDGLALTRRLRAQGDVPILMVSARGEEIDRVIGLEVGADDYLPKPFGPRELLARVRSLWRRSQRGAAPHPAGAAGASSPAFGPFVVDLAGRRLLRDGVERRLSSGEFDLLALFVTQPRRVLSRDALLQALAHRSREAFDRSIDNRVLRLRRHIEDDPATPRYIRTVRNAGYRFVPDGDGA